MRAIRRIWMLLATAAAVVAVTIAGSLPAQAVKQDEYLSNVAGWLDGAKAAGVQTFPAVADYCPRGVKTVSEDRDVAYAAQAFRDSEGTCQVVYNTRVDGGAPSDYQSFCALTVHEFGHLAGWRDPDTGETHSADPESIMNATIRVVPSACGSGRAVWEPITPS